MTKKDKNKIMMFSTSSFALNGLYATALADFHEFIEILTYHYSTGDVETLTKVT